ncbi:PREDICTED: proline-rich protein 4-like [Ipomoea nil]|uniref:proline-rich protein 4-like n=1 Tax=Ipomoea nil TaxID=35883 RepID=UPI0009011450|nr:PREDICTED: proline-rich protein 4-like [Ipomoea nil]
MGLKSLCRRGILLGFLLSLFLVMSFCYADDKTVQVVGFGECGDCKENNIQTTQAFSELRVSIDCKLENGEMRTRGMGKLDKDGKFEVSLPAEIVKHGGGLKEECYAQLQTASSSAPCPAHNAIEASKIVKTGGKKHGFEAAGKLKFSAAICTSAFLPHFKKPFFKKPLPHPFPFYKPKPHPIIPIYKPKPKPPVYIPHVPIYKPKPKPPVYKPPTPVYKPKPNPPVYKPPTPVYKPKPPVYKPPTPVYKPKPFPHVPIYKPFPKPPIIYYKPPFKPFPFHKPKPPVYIPPFKKPCPPPFG